MVSPPQPPALREGGGRWLRFGLLLVGGTFVVVSVTLALQIVNATVRPIGGLHYLLAACDPPAVAGAWLAAAGSRGKKAHPPLLAAALALTTVAAVVLGDLVLGRVAPTSSIARAISSKGAWLAADAATVVSLAALAVGARRISDRWPAAVGPTLAVLLVVRCAAALLGASGSVPWPLRAPEPILFLLVSFVLFRAARAVSTLDVGAANLRSSAP